MINEAKFLNKIAMYNQIFLICGAPRSGTSWVGQILDSSPDTAYRYQPLFSWAFKNCLNIVSKKTEYLDFFKKIYYSKDDFLLQTERKKKGLYPKFNKKRKNPPTLLIKMIRYHYLLQPMLEHFHDILKLVFIVRHPCGVINSWLKTPKEFITGLDPIREWEKADSRNIGKPEEYWGYEGWKRALDICLKIKDEFPTNIYLLNYERLVENTLIETEKIFNFLKIDITTQTFDFIASCHATHDNDPYSVYKMKGVKDNWKTELDPRIKNIILKKIEQLPLYLFSSY